MPARGLLMSSTEVLHQAQKLRDCSRLLVKESQQVCEESVAMLAKIEATLARLRGSLPSPARAPAFLRVGGVLRSAPTS